MFRTALRTLLIAATAATAAAQGGMVYSFPLYQTTQPSTSSASYNAFTNGLTAWDKSESTNVNVAGGDGPWTLEQWRITLTNPPGAGNSWTFTLRVNEADTALAVTIADGATSGSDSTHKVVIKPGDRYDIRCTPTGTPAAPGDMQRLVRITASAPRRQMLATPSAVSHPLAPARTYYMAPDQRGNQTNEKLAKFPWAATGTLSSFYADLETAPGAGASVKITLRKNEQDTDVTCTATGEAKACRDVQHHVNVAAGDLIDWKIDISEGSPTTRVRVGTAFEPAVDGQVVYIFEGAVLSGATTYIAGEVAGSKTETKTLTMPAARVGSLVNSSEANPGADGQSDALTVRRNKEDTELACSVVGPAKYGSDTQHYVPFAEGDALTVRLVASEGNLTVAKASIVMEFEQPTKRAPKRQPK